MKNINDQFSKRSNIISTKFIDLKMTEGRNKQNKKTYTAIIDR